jgi:putative transposase
VREWHQDRQNAEIQGDDHCPAGDCKAICREGDSNHTFNIAPNLLDQNFSADGPNQKWAGDISYIWTSEGWLYLAVILDLYSRRVIGWAVSNRMKRDLAIRALDMAVALRQPPKDCIHHTDRGSQYCSNEYQRRLSKHGFKVSMSGKGNCYDNSMVETFFKSITLGTLLRNTLPRNARLS